MMVMMLVRMDTVLRVMAVVIVVVRLMMAFRRGRIVANALC